MDTIKFLKKEVICDLFSAAYVTQLLREKQTIILVNCKDFDLEKVLMQFKKAAANNVGSRIRRGH